MFVFQYWFSTLQFTAWHFLHFVLHFTLINYDWLGLGNVMLGAPHTRSLFLGFFLTNGCLIVFPFPQKLGKQLFIIFSFLWLNNYFIDKHMQWYGSNGLRESFPRTFTAKVSFLSRGGEKWKACGWRINRENPFGMRMQKEKVFCVRLKNVPFGAYPIYDDGKSHRQITLHFDGIFPPQ